MRVLAGGLLLDHVAEQLVGLEGGPVDQPVEGREGVHQHVGDAVEDLVDPVAGPIDHLADELQPELDQHENDDDQPQGHEQSDHECRHQGGEYGDDEHVPGVGAPLHVVLDDDELQGDAADQVEQRDAEADEVEELKPRHNESLLE